MASKAVAATVVSTSKRKLDKRGWFVTFDSGLPQDFARIYTSLGLGKGEYFYFLGGTMERRWNGTWCLCWT